jgi:SET domain
VFPKTRQLSRAQWFTSLHERRDEAQKKRFESLYNSKKTEILGHNSMDLTKADSNCEGISRTNQIEFRLMSDESHQYFAVYGAVSRLNHSFVCLFCILGISLTYTFPRCGPNTAWEWSDKSFSLQQRACRSIKAGEELTAEYCDNFSPKAARQSLLKERYQFVCVCPWCSLTGGQVD